MHVKLLVSTWSSQEDSSSVTVQQEDPSPEVKVTVDSYQTIAVIFFNAACVKSHTVELGYQAHICYLAHTAY